MTKDRAGWPDKAPDSELFDRINAHISAVTDDIAIKNICAEFQQRLEAYRIALTPKEWTIAHSIAWKNNANTAAGFNALREIAEKAAPQQELEG